MLILSLKQTNILQPTWLHRWNAHTFIHPNMLILTKYSLTHIYQHIYFLMCDIYVHIFIFNYKHKHHLKFTWTQTHIITTTYSHTLSQMHINTLNVKLDYHSFIHICVFKHTSELMNLLKHKIVINMHIVANNMLTIHSQKRA